MTPTWYMSLPDEEPRRRYQLAATLRGGKPQTVNDYARDDDGMASIELSQPPLRSCRRQLPLCVEPSESAGERDVDRLRLTGAGSSLNQLRLFSLRDSGVESVSGSDPTSTEMEA
jgi:hypothetical protein